MRSQERAPLRRVRLLSAAATLALVTGAPLVAQDSRFALTNPIPIDPAVRIGRLDNGLTYYIRRNTQPEERAELRLVVDAGSILEDEDQRGLAHVVEHMAFNGTRNFERQELVHYIESIGMRFGPDLNASTNFDETIYMLTIPTDDEEIVSTAFRILDDWASGITFEPEEIDAERGVVIEEWRGRRGAGMRILEEQIPILLHGSRYAERLPIGLRETLETFEHESLIRFYERWYRPDLMAVIAVGDFDPAAIEELIRANFSDNSARNPAPRRNEYLVPGHEETLFHAMTDPELTLTQLQIIYKRPPESLATVADYRGLLVERLYNDMFNARLNEITRKPNAPFLAGGSGGVNYVRGMDAYGLEAIVVDGGVERGLEAILTEAERVARHGFTPTELERTKLNLLRALERANAERERTNSSAHVAEYINHFLLEEPVPGIEYEYAMAQALLDGITIEEIDALARELITEENRVILVSGPDKPDLPLPGLDELRQVMAAVDEAEITPYEDTFVDAPLLSALPRPSRVVEEIQHDAVDVIEWRLANGVRVFLKTTDFREDQVLLRGYSPGGLSLVSDEEYLDGSIATTLANASGVGEFSAPDLRRVLAGKAAGAAPTLSELEEGISGTASPRDIETMFQLTYLHFTSPRQDQEAITALLEQLRAVYANRDADPATAFGDTFTVTLNQYHPRSIPPTFEDIENIDSEVAMRIYRDRFADASDFTFVLVGNLDPVALRPLVEQYLGGLPSTGRSETWRDVGVRPAQGVIEKVVRRGLEPRATTRIAFTGQDEYSVEDAHLIRSLASVLGIRLREVLREDLGGTYGVSVGGSLSNRPIESFAFSISFSTDPARIEELVDSVFVEIERLKREGPSERDVASVREMQRREYETALRTNGFWLDQIVFHTRAGRDLTQILEMDSLVEGVTAASIQEAANRWLPEENYVRVTLYPAETP